MTGMDEERDRLRKMYPKVWFQKPPARRPPWPPCPCRICVNEYYSDGGKSHVSCGKPCPHEDRTGPSNVPVVA